MRSATCWWAGRYTGKQTGRQTRTRNKLTMRRTLSRTGCQSSHRTARMIKERCHFVAFFKRPFRSVFMASIGPTGLLLLVNKFFMTTLAQDLTTVTGTSTPTVTTTTSVCLTVTSTTCTTRALSCSCGHFATNYLYAAQTGIHSHTLSLH